MKKRSPFNMLVGALPAILFIFLSAGCGGYVQGNLALARGDYQQAERIFEQRLVQNPEDTTARRRLAMTYFYMGRDVDSANYAKSIQEFSRIAEVRDPTPEEQFYHAFALIGQGRRSEGFELLQNFSYPRQFRTQQFVRERAGQLESNQELPPREIFTRMERAWEEGQEEDRRERLEDRDNTWETGNGV